MFNMLMTTIYSCIFRDSETRIGQWRVYFSLSIYSNNNMD